MANDAVSHLARDGDADARGLAVPTVEDQENETLSVQPPPFGLHEQKIAPKEQTLCRWQSLGRLFGRDAHFL